MSRAFVPGSGIADALSRCETDWQRTVIREWSRRNPEPDRMLAGHLGWIEFVAHPMHCSECSTPGVAIPDMSMIPARGYFICPRCSAPANEAVA